MAWKLQENFILRYLGEKIPFELWKCIRDFFEFSVFPTSHSPPPSLTHPPPRPWGAVVWRQRRIFPLQNVQSSSKTQELPGLRRVIYCAHQFFLLLPGSQVSVFSLSYFSCLNSDSAPSWFPPGYMFYVWTAFTLCSGSLDIFLLAVPQILFRLWLSRTW